MPWQGYLSTLPSISRELQICFLLPGLGPSGGVAAVLEHARGLDADPAMRVTLVVAERVAEDHTDGVRTISLAEAREESFDLAVATWWRMAYALFDVHASRRAYFLQTFEERLYRPGDVERLGAAITHGLPLSFITEASWIAGLLAELRPDAPCFHVPNGIDKGLYAGPPEPPRRDTAAPLRILIEGSPELWFKGVDEAIAAAARMTRSREVTLVTPERPTAAPGVHRVLGPLGKDEMPAVYREADLLLKLSRVEGVFTPPLEAFHMGTTCVVWPVTGHDEYVVHGENGVVAEWDDEPGTARWLDLLAVDRELLHQLRAGALRTASAWPSWEQSTAAMSAALREIVEAPAPSTEEAMARLLGDVRANMEELRREQVATQRRTLHREAELREDIAQRERRYRELTTSRAHVLTTRIQRSMAVVRRLRLAAGRRC